MELTLIHLKNKSFIHLSCISEKKEISLINVVQPFSFNFTICLDFERTWKQPCLHTSISTKPSPPKIKSKSQSLHKTTSKKAQPSTDSKLQPCSQKPLTLRLNHSNKISQDSNCPMPVCWLIRSG